MKYIGFLSLILVILISCKTSIKLDTNAALKNDTIRIANDMLEYEILIIDAGFNSWLAQYGKPRGYYSQPYLEARNLDWTNAWNNNSYLPRNPNIFLNPIDYQYGINYGYEVNYLLYNYLAYFQITNKIKLGSFVAKP